MLLISVIVALLVLMAIWLNWAVRQNAHNLNVLNYNMEILLSNQKVLKEEVESNNNSIKIQLPDGYQFNDTTTNMVVPL